MIEITTKDGFLDAKVINGIIAVVDKDEKIKIHCKDGPFGTVLNVLDFLGIDYKIKGED